MFHCSFLISPGTGHHPPQPHSFSPPLPLFPPSSHQHHRSEQDDDDDDDCIHGHAYLVLGSKLKPHPNTKVNRGNKQINRGGCCMPPQEMFKGLRLGDIKGNDP